MTTENAEPIDFAEAPNCPKCGADWQGAPIPETHREHYGNKTHFRSVIAIYDRELDCTVAYRCPDCGEEFPRDPAIVEQVRDKHEPVDVQALVRLFREKKP